MLLLFTGTPIQFHLPSSNKTASPQITSRITPPSQQMSPPILSTSVPNQCQVTMPPLQPSSSDSDPISQGMDTEPQTTPPRPTSIATTLNTG